MKAETVPLSSITPDERNANRGTERGRYALEHSLEKLGAGRSILLDKKGRIIAGNKTAETAGEIGIEEVVIVRTKGDKLVAVMREDLDLDEPAGAARELAYADNRVGQLDLEFDPAVIELDLAAGLDLGDWFKPYELSILTGDMPEGIDPNEEWKGMPEFEQEEAGAYKTIKVHFLSEGDYQEFARLVNQPLTEKTISIYYPRKLAEDLTKYTVQDE